MVTEVVVVFVVIVLPLVVVVVLGRQTEEFPQGPGCTTNDTVLVLVGRRRVWNKFGELVESFGGLDVERDRSVLDFADRVRELGEVDVIIKLLGDSLDSVNKGINTDFVDCRKCDTHLARYWVNSLAY